MFWEIIFEVSGKKGCDAGMSQQLMQEQSDGNLQYPYSTVAHVNGISEKKMYPGIRALLANYKDDDSLNVARANVRRQRAGCCRIQSSKFS